LIVIVAIFVLSLGCGPADDSQQASALTTKGESANQCENLVGVLERIECYVKLATDNDDPSVCGQSSHEGVEYQCYAIVAERQSDEGLCDLIPPRSPDHQKLRDICISDVAKKTVNPLACDRIQTAGLRDSCYAKIGQETGNAELCEKVQDPGLKSMCSGEPVMVQ
jgi:hypothetical protein